MSILGCGYARNIAKFVKDVKKKNSFEAATICVVGLVSMATCTSDSVFTLIARTPLIKMSLTSVGFPKKETLPSNNGRTK